MISYYPQIQYHLLSRDSGIKKQGVKALASYGKKHTSNTMSTQ